MAREPPSLTGAFHSLPIELNQLVARELETDKDIASFRATCPSTRNAIDADMGSFWRAKFREKFALRAGTSNMELQTTYQRRMKQLCRGTGYSFFRGHRQREVDVVTVLRELIVESFQGPYQVDEHDRPRCKNQTMLQNFVINSKILLNDRRAPPPERGEHSHHVHPLLAAVKLMCSHFLFELEGAKHNVFAAEESQRVVYMATNTAPIYQGLTKTEVNMEWVLHCLHFFRHHMMNEEVATLHEVMDELTPRQKPSAWQGPLRRGSYPLGNHWKGTYAFLDVAEIKKLRKLSPDEVGDEYLCDKNVDEGKVQSLQLEFVSSTGPVLRWPRIFEQRLHSLRNMVEPQGRSKPKGPGLDNIQFTGTGVDLEDDFNAIGWLNPLPDQQGIPGWQRITFMKHFMDDFDQVEQDNLWAYEGVVLPGGRIILGRWWYASENVDFNCDYNGPFILWAVDDPDVEEEEVSEDED